jgi:hypothetical protein
MDISVYLQTQDHATGAPAHRTTRTMMGLVLAAELGEQVGQNKLRLTTDLSWKKVKAFARHAIPRRHVEVVTDLPVCEYPLNEMCLDVDFQRQMAYPLLLAKDQRSTVGRWLLGLERL